MTYTDLLREAGTMGVHVEERRLGPGRCGCYYDPARLIIIDETMPDHEKTCTLAHELAHARHRDTGHDDAKAERRARREATLRLIDPAEYALAEHMYEGDTFLTAQALDVTVQIIQDYKAMLHDGITAWQRKRQSTHAATDGPTRQGPRP